MSIKAIIIIGSAPCARENLLAMKSLLKGQRYHSMAIGLDAATVSHDPIEHVATLHPYDLPEFHDRRFKAGLNTDYIAHSHEPYAPPQGLLDLSQWPWPDHKPSGETWVDNIWTYEPPSGSSALLGVQVALALGYQKIILAGCPLDSGRYSDFQRGWTERYSDLKDKVRSVSGWTKELLGAPTEDWLNMETDQKKRFEDIWDHGDYRRGSTALRLVEMLIEHIPPGSIINDYGSGTGRAEVELMKLTDYKINMIDIAENALEADARALLSDRLTFTQANIWSLPENFPRADWGLCINTLMVLPPEKIDQSLCAISNTCDNLFFELYDVPDNRLGMDQTLTKGDADFWRAKLEQHWPEVEFVPSPESRRRYIFVCRR